MPLLQTKSIDELIRSSEEPAHRLKRTLGPWSLAFLGVGIVIGSGIFTVTGNVTDSFGNTGSGTPEYTFSLDVGPSGGQVPESPIIVLLPVVALGAVGAVLFINRRRRVARTQS